ncbi:alpha-amylase family glycosyl hydrolase [Pseudoalteromonas sp. Of7M-16]|uniref:alpha-amylase family glycosyl hydrolase n=1 Tax=Pseudoalteromonas sp. Of7M-16 TaxID=2917756 RepID=UPI001EF652F3|nr:alpha-amylase family glycosyl hydrolase [Pseudoalteromonas sp. Of7M-16]MCG7546554.1 alpha-amylase family glycosyl hydrolase [Pseudoalteromonas sp. Of7M-16]
MLENTNKSLGLHTRFKPRYIIASTLLSLTSHLCIATDDVMLQGFYWDVPVDEKNKNGIWWDHLAEQAPALAKAGFSSIWIPPPSKGNWGIIDMGYGVYDHYDLGRYLQKGSIETRFGSQAELTNMISTLQQHHINVYADVVLNHIYSNEQDSEINPAVKAYALGKAHQHQYVAYPSNEINWQLKDVQGRVFIKIQGYGSTMPWQQSITTRGYALSIKDSKGQIPSNAIHREQEPNDGNYSAIRPGSNAFSGLNTTMRGQIIDQADIDEYWLDVPNKQSLYLSLSAKQGDPSSQTNWTDTSQTNGFLPIEVWQQSTPDSPAVNITASHLFAYTNTRIALPQRDADGNYPNSDDGWRYHDFHPVDGDDWLGEMGNDEVITNTKFFGNDTNTFSPRVQQKLIDWGKWLKTEHHFDGFRLDFVRGFQPEFAAKWVNNLPKHNGKQPFVVAEYWGGDSSIKSWVDTVHNAGADVDAFDFPLKSVLTQMTNQNQNFDMRTLNHAGLVRNDRGHQLPGTSVVTFVENHDTGKEYDKWVSKDHKLAYAYILSHEGKPTVFYSHYYGVKQYDYHDPSKTITAPASLKQEINKLMFARNTYMDGGLAVLSKIGSPYGDVQHVYVARRFGKLQKQGAIVVLNNHDTQRKGLWVTTHATGFSNLAGQTLVNAFDPDDTVTVYEDGRGYFSAPSRGYTIYVPQGDLQTYPKN